METLKQKLSQFRAWLVHVLTHFAHWIRAVAISIGVAAAQVVADGLTIEKAMAMSLKEWAFRIGLALLPLLLALKAGERNQSVDEIAEALRSKGHLPPPPASGFARLALILGLALGSALGLLACEPAEVNRVIGIQPASAMTSPTASVQFVALGAAPPITWAVTEANGGTITSSGLYTGPGCSTTLTGVHITASAGGVTSAPAVVVLQEKVISVAVAPGSVTVAPNGAVQFTATVTTDCAAYATSVDPKTGKPTTTVQARKAK